MGLLPTGTGDWLAFETRGPVSHSFPFDFARLFYRPYDDRINNAPLGNVSILFTYDKHSNPSYTLSLAGGYAIAVTELLNKCPAFR